VPQILQESNVEQDKNDVFETSFHKGVITVILLYLIKLVMTGFDSKPMKIHATPFPDAYHSTAKQIAFTNNLD